MSVPTTIADFPIIAEGHDVRVTFSHIHPYGDTSKSALALTVDQAVFMPQGHGQRPFEDPNLPLFDGRFRPGDKDIPFSQAQVADESIFGSGPGSEPKALPCETYSENITKFAEAYRETVQKINDRSSAYPQDHAASQAIGTCGYGLPVAIKKGWEATVAKQALSIEGTKKDDKPGLE